MRISSCLLLSAALAAMTSMPSRGQLPVPNERLALVVLVAVDQLRPDYLDRYHEQFRGGFRLLRDSAAFFPNGHQEHAMTETAPGHSAMLSGREPAHTGIFSNDRGVPDSTVSVLEAPGVIGASPRRFRGTTLFAFLGPGIRPATYARVVRSVDIAPTLAQLLGVRPLQELDGVPISEVIRGVASAP